MAVVVAHRATHALAVEEAIRRRQSCLSKFGTARHDWRFTVRSARYSGWRIPWWYGKTSPYRVRSGWVVIFDADRETRRCSS